VNRRELLQCGLGITGAVLPWYPAQADGRRSAPAVSQFCLTVRSVDVELAPGIVVPVLTCNDTVGGPLIGLDPSQAAGVVIHNDADHAVTLDGPWIREAVVLAPGERAQATVLPMHSGFGHALLTADGHRGVVHGVAGLFVPASAPETADQVHHLNIHHWLPRVTPGAGARLAAGVTHRYATLGDTLLSAAEPLRVREGERVRFRFFNASPRKCVTLSLPRHQFTVVAFDGHPVPRPRAVQHVFLGPGERVEALVYMNRRGRYVLGSIDRRDCDAGFGRVIEYVNTRGAAQRGAIEPSCWDYGAFGTSGPEPAVRGELKSLPVEFGELSGATDSGSLWLNLEQGRRYRLSMLNAAGEPRSVALRGHRIELKNVAGSSMHGVVKDTLSLPIFARTEVEFIAAAPTVELLHSAGADRELPRMV
jgi:Multicopper oxidase